MRKKTVCEFGSLGLGLNERFSSAIISEKLNGLPIMTAIHATILSAERFRDQYRFIVKLVPSEFVGPFERLRFKKNPYCGSFGTSVDKSWLTLDYRKDPGFKAGEVFPLWRTGSLNGEK